MRTILAVAISTLAVASAATISESQENTFQTNLPAFIKQAQKEHVLPMKELTVKDHSLRHTQHGYVSFDVTLEDKDNSTYSGTLNVREGVEENRLDAEITTWNNSQNSNQNLPKVVEINYGSDCGNPKVRDVVKIVNDEANLKSVFDKLEASNTFKHLRSYYSDLKISDASILQLESLCGFYNCECISGAPKNVMKVQVNVTGTYKGKQHHIPITVKAERTMWDNITKLKTILVYPADEDLCSILLTQPLKHLQKENLIPDETFTVKKEKCKINNWSNKIDEEVTYDIELELEDSQHVVYPIKYRANFNSVFAEITGEINEFEWNTSGAKVQENNHLFPTKSFKPSLDCHLDVEKPFDNQKAFPSNQEMPVKLFKSILNEKPQPKELAGKTFTVQDIKVNSMKAWCSKYGMDPPEIKYDLTGTLVTADGLKFRADVSGKYFKEASGLRKVANFFTGKQKHDYANVDRYVSDGTPKITLIN